MDRRLTGALLVVAVLTAAITVPVLDGVRIAGAPSMIQLPADPRVGDCLAASADDALDLAESGTGLNGSSAWRNGAPKDASSVLGPLFTGCGSQPATGEVVALVATDGDPQSRRHRVAQSGPDCHEAGLRYAGLTPIGDHFALPDHPAADPVTWRLSISVQTAWIYPSPLLQSRGRTWAACVVAPIRGRSFVGRLADAFDGGTMPNEYGTCWNSRDVSASIKPVSCGQPHLAELISAGFVPDRSLTSTKEVKDSCKRLAAQVARRADPTVGGALVIKTSPDRIVTRESGVSVSVLCYFTARDRALAGSLFGLGDQSVPYAN